MEKVTSAYILPVRRPAHSLPTLTFSDTFGDLTNKIKYVNVHID